jgi:hypothetical protein
MAKRLTLVPCVTDKDVSDSVCRQGWELFRQSVRSAPIAHNHMYPFRNKCQKSRVSVYNTHDMHLHTFNGFAHLRKSN